MATETEVPKSTPTEEEKVVEQAGEPSEVPVVKETEAVTEKSVPEAGDTAKTVEAVLGTKIEETVKDEKAPESASVKEKAVEEESKKPETEAEKVEAAIEKENVSENVEFTTKEIPPPAAAKVDKQQNSIISKMKQSFVKAKKAITGKSKSQPKQDEIKVT